MTKPKRHRPQPTRQYPRTYRVNELVREITAEELERIDDERLELVAITSVDVDRDLRHAVVWFDTLPRRGDATTRRSKPSARPVSRSRPRSAGRHA